MEINLSKKALWTNERKQTSDTQAQTSAEKGLRVQNLRLQWHKAK